MPPRAVPPDVAWALERIVNPRLARLPAVTRDIDTPLSPEVRQALEALGYLD